MARKRRSQSRTVPLQKISDIAATHRRTLIAVHANRADLAPRHKNTPKNRQKDAQPASLSQLRVVDLRFLEELSIFSNQILNAVAHMGV